MIAPIMVRENSMAVSCCRTLYLIILKDMDQKERNEMRILAKLLTKGTSRV